MSVESFPLLVNEVQIIHAEEAKRFNPLSPGNAGLLPKVALCTWNVLDVAIMGAVVLNRINTHEYPARQ